MKKICLLLLCLPLGLFAQKPRPKTTAVPPAAQALDRPKLIVGIVVDQMRYDFLYRYWDKYGSGGFRRLLREGLSCENTHYDYVPTVTGAGHAAVFTGSVPAVNGIIGNEWYSRQLGRALYVAEDSTVNTVGSTSLAGKMSPRNLLTTTITDELRLATNLRAKVIGICLKDRGCILPAGHTANAAYWYDGATGNWITSTYYMDELPPWLTDFNNRKLSDQYLSKPWELLLPADQYAAASTADDSPFELLFRTEAKTTFPHDLPALRKNADYDLLRGTPFGNTLTADLAIETLHQELMGKGSATDFLTLSFSSTDYVGHQYGPNSVESEDTYLRLDRDLERLLTFIDNWTGKDQTLVFLTADHGVVAVPGYLKQQRIPAGIYDGRTAMYDLKEFAKKTFGEGAWVLDYGNQQVYLNRPLIAASKLTLADVQRRLAEYLTQQTGVASAVAATDVPTLADNNPLTLHLQNGFNVKRSGDIIVTLEPAWYSGNAASKGGTTHGTGYAYDTHVPLLWYGWHVTPGVSWTPTNVSDIAPTVAAMLRILEPNGTVGKPIEALRK